MDTTIIRFEINERAHRDILYLKDGHSDERYALDERIALLNVLGELGLISTADESISFGGDRHVVYEVLVPDGKLVCDFLRTLVEADPKVEAARGPAVSPKLRRAVHHLDRVSER